MRFCAHMPNQREMQEKNNNVIVFSVVGFSELWVICAICTEGSGPQELCGSRQQGLYGGGLNGNADVLAFCAWQTVNSGSGLWCVLLFAASIVIVLKIPITDKIVLVPGAASLGP